MQESVDALAGIFLDDKVSNVAADVLASSVATPPTAMGLLPDVKLRVVYAPGMPGTFSPPPLISDHDMHHGTCITHVPWCMSG